jgi:Xaa-Pro dipeptidase
MRVKKRVKNIFNNLEKKPDAIIIKNSVQPFIDDNFFYVTGLEKGVFEKSMAILHPDGDIDLVVSELEAETAKKANVNLNVYRNKEDLDKLLKRLLLSLRKIGVNFDGISYKDFCKLRDKCSRSEFLDVSESFIKVRLVKDAFEIGLIRKSCVMADKVMKEIPDILHGGMYEYEIAAEIDYLLQKNGADKPAFETISSFGRNTAEPHYSHGSTRLKKGDFVLFDFGACFRKYNSDITRTFVFGKADEEQREMYKNVLEAQSIGFDMIKPGVKANKVHDVVSSYIDNTKFKGHFIHSTGHSLGLAVHDGGAGFTPDDNVELKENMVFTVEPGIYVPGFGGVRIEDDVLIRKNGIELLTRTPRELIEI